MRNTHPVIILPLFVATLLVPARTGATVAAAVPANRGW